MSTTTNLKLFKHDNPTTNTNQFDVEKALNENWDKIDKNAGEIASKIQTLENTTNEKDTSQDAEIEVLKAENALLKSQIPSATVVGETIHLEDSSNMQCQISPIGASIQEGTPSIDSEAPIESVGDNINLFDKDNARNGYYSIYGGALTEGNANWYYCVIKGAKNTELTLSGVSATNTSIGLVELDGSKSFLKGLSAYSNKTFTTSEECEYIGISCRVEDIDTLKLEKGPKATPYSPYGQGCIEIINSNKNLLDLGNDTFASNGLNITNEISKITVDGTLEASWAKGSKSKSCLLKAGTYTFSIDKPLTHHIYLAFTFEDSTTRTLQINRDNLSNQITTDKNIIKYNVGFSGVTNGTTYNEVIYLQLEKGEIATDYVEHQSQTKALYTQQPFRSIGEVKDRFVKVDGVWYEEHNIERYILDGSTNKLTAKHSSITSDTNGFYLFKLANKILGVSGSADYGKCNYLQYIANNKPAEVIEKIGLWWEAYDGSEMNYASLPFLTLEEANAWLMELYNAGTPLYIDYVLAEPLLIPCTPEQVEVLESFNTYKNVTNISSNSIGELEVFYYKDLETLLGGA